MDIEDEFHFALFAKIRVKNKNKKIKTLRMDDFNFSKLKS